ncbi:hypothetical protein BVG19_g2169 [[Candida] boidinii]|nr:hypothetical protein BVG19_g2169 [[Candida] boidinii]OWB53835.1 hypothetical protein B5S27_g5445 [[Candida] boidinii]
MNNFLLRNCFKFKFKLNYNSITPSLIPSKSISNKYKNKYKYPVSCNYSTLSQHKLIEKNDSILLNSQHSYKPYQSYQSYQLNKSLGIRSYSTNKQPDKDHPNNEHSNNEKKSTKNELKNDLFKRKNLQDFLQTSTSWLQRLYYRIKWFLIKSIRPFNTDEYGAFLTWLLTGNILLLIIGTTTFFSLLLYTVNTVFAQELVAQFLGNLITKNSNLNVTFENAIVPEWKEGKIHFQKCFVSRRPRPLLTNNTPIENISKNNNNNNSSNDNNNNIEKINDNSRKFKKGSQKESIELATTHNNSNNTDNHIVYDDGNYTQFDLTIEEVIISFSFSKWLSGKGIIKDCELKGMRGVVDRSHVFWKLNDKATNYKNIYKPGDWEIENFKLEDVLFTLLQPNGFRPFNVSIYSCDMPLLRKNWLFYDMLNANHMSGSYDGSLFTIHKRQRINDFEIDEEEMRYEREINKLTKYSKKNGKLINNNYNYDDYDYDDDDDINLPYLINKYKKKLIYYNDFELLRLLSKFSNRCNNLLKNYESEISNGNAMPGITTTNDSTNSIKSNKKFKKGQLPFKRATRLRVDNLNLDHLNKGIKGPFGWITSGTVDMIGDVMVPADDEFSVAEMIKIITDSISQQTSIRNDKNIIDSTASNATTNTIPTDTDIITPTIPSPPSDKKDLSKYFVLDFYLRLNNPKATVPLFPDELSYINSALIRPIVGYINSRKTYIPIKCRVVKNISDFDGSWTMYDSLLMDDLQVQVYDAFTNYVADENFRNERARKIGFWSLQFLIQFVLWSLGTIAS